MAQFRIVDCDNVRETFTGTGSTTITLGGAAQYSRSLSGAGFASGDTSFMTARIGAEESTGIFTHNGSTVTQTSVWRSSNGNAAVSFTSGGVGEIFIDSPARLFDELNLAEITVASAATCDIGGTAAQAGKILISGTTTITSLGTGANKRRMVRFSGILTLTNNATSLILPGGANITTDAGSTALFASDSSGNWRCYAFQYASGAVITGNVSITGTLGVSSNLAVNTNKFNVTASNGNTAIAGTLTQTGAATFVANSHYNVVGGTGAGFWLDSITTGADRLFFGSDASGPDTFRIYSALAGANVLSYAANATPANGTLSLAGNINTTGGAAITGAVVVGSPTGGNKGAGTINATAVYDDNVLLTCMALEFLNEGKVDTDYWDSTVPDRIIPAEIIPARVEQIPITEDVEVVKTVLDPVDGGYVAREETQIISKQVSVFAPVHDADGNGIDAVEEPVFETREIPEQVVREETIERRRHDLAHRFQAMLDEGFDPRSPVAYITKLKKDQALPGMPTKEEWDHGSHSVGEIHNRLWLATELLAMTVVALEGRITALEARR